MSSPSHNNAIRIAFLVALAGKIISAVLSIILNSPWVFGFGIPLTIMLVYMIFGHFQTHKGCYRIRQGYGDSCYYLGFLFTVASIILALFVLGSEDNLVTSELAIRFAAAMVTTLLGMAVRVYIVTFADKEDGGCHEFCVLRDNSRPRRALPTRQHAKQDPTQTYS